MTKSVTDASNAIRTSITKQVSSLKGQSHGSTMLCRSCLLEMQFKAPSWSERNLPAPEKFCQVCNRKITLKQQRYCCAKCKYHVCTSCGDSAVQSLEQNTEAAVGRISFLSASSATLDEAVPPPIALAVKVLSGSSSSKPKSRLYVKLTMGGIQRRTKICNQTSPSSYEWQETLLFYAEQPRLRPRRDGPQKLLVEVIEAPACRSHKRVGRAMLTICTPEDNIGVDVPCFGALILKFTWSVVMALQPQKQTSSFTDWVRNVFISSTLSIGWPTLDLSIRLVDEVPKMLQFLAEVDRFPCLYLNNSILRRAIWRYEHVWLPLLCKTSELTAEGKILVPPLDVEWVWHVHTLAPHHYHKDSMQVVSQLSDTLGRRLSVPRRRLYSRFCEREKYLQSSRAAWEKSCRDEPFDAVWLETAAMSDEGAHGQNCSEPGMQPASESVIGYNILAACERQMAFFPQVSLPHYVDERFLAAAALRYSQHLELKRRYPERILAPTYDIDVCWHAHMCNTMEYLEDTTRILGQVMKHDDTMNDRSEGSRLNNAWEDTVESWQEAFGSSPSSFGGMLRSVVTAEEKLQQSRQQQILSELDSCISSALEASVESNKHCFTFGYRGQRSLTSAELSAALARQSSCTMHEGSLRRAVSETDEIVAAESSGFCIASPSASSTASSGKSSTANKPLQTVMFEIRSLHAIHGQRTLCNFCELLEIGNHLPLATAHSIGLSQLPVIDQLKEPWRSPCLKERNMPVLLRHGGKDFGILLGTWLGTKAPVPGVKGVPGTPGDKAQWRMGVPGKPGRKGEPGHPGWLHGA